MMHRRLDGQTECAASSHAQLQRRVFAVLHHELLNGGMDSRSVRVHRAGHNEIGMSSRMLASASKKPGPGMTTTMFVVTTSPTAISANRANALATGSFTGSLAVVAAVRATRDVHRMSVSSSSRPAG